MLTLFEEYKNSGKISDALLIGQNIFNKNPGDKEAEEKFKEAGVTLYTLSNYNAVLEAAAETGYINSEDIETLKVWRENPSQWMQE